MTAESSDTWAGWYRDRQGAEAITFLSDGGRLRTAVRGVPYEGGDFATLEPVADGPALTGCVMEWDMPLPVNVDGAAQQATLSCLLTLGDKGPELSLTLHWGGAAYASGIAGGDFEGALGRIRHQLPGGTDLTGRTLVGA
ncbi:DUF6304 family protein [Streptomyces fuscigenes]|uniref:DUF6304 family protein n=1 Tax=Streptomyces fuscigenes TaxID=1528880 RepID=UPI001F44E54E|nr:DUF6304 family protein [Streptomyces fuscigenes]MCF3962688.1 DUF6304 family protein [Streptomyces fuscigenes]